MSVIAITVSQTESRAPVLHRLHLLTGKRAIDLRRSIGEGSPIVEMSLFDGDYEASATLLRSLVSFLSETEIAFAIHEFPEGASAQSCPNADRYKVSAEVLLNILDEADAELDRQLGD